MVELRAVFRVSCLGSGCTIPVLGARMFRGAWPPQILCGLFWFCSSLLRLPRSPRWFRGLAASPGGSQVQKDMFVHRAFACKVVVFMSSGLGLHFEGMCRHIPFDFGGVPHAPSVFVFGLVCQGTLGHSRIVLTCGRCFFFGRRAELRGTTWKTRRRSFDRPLSC